MTHLRLVTPLPAEEKQLRQTTTSEKAGIILLSIGIISDAIAIALCTVFSNTENNILDTILIPLQYTGVAEMTAGIILTQKGIRDSLVEKRGNLKIV